MDKLKKEELDNQLEVLKRIILGKLDSIKNKKFEEKILDELSLAYRVFLLKYLKLSYEFTEEELAKELEHVKISKFLKERIINLSGSLTDAKYTGKGITQDEFKNIIEEAISIVKQALHFHEPKPKESQKEGKGIISSLKNFIFKHPEKEPRQVKKEHTHTGRKNTEEESLKQDESSKYADILPPPLPTPDIEEPKAHAGEKNLDKSAEGVKLEKKRRLELEAAKKEILGKNKEEERLQKQKEQEEKRIALLENKRIEQERQRELEELSKQKEFEEKKRRLELEAAKKEKQRKRFEEILRKKQLQNQEKIEKLRLKKEEKRRELEFKKHALAEQRAVENIKKFKQELSRRDAEKIILQEKLHQEESKLGNSKIPESKEHPGFLQKIMDSVKINKINDFAQNAKEQDYRMLEEKKKKLQLEAQIKIQEEKLRQQIEEIKNKAKMRQEARLAEERIIREKNEQIIKEGEDKTRKTQEKVKLEQEQKSGDELPLYQKKLKEKPKLQEEELLLRHKEGILSLNLLEERKRKEDNINLEIEERKKSLRELKRAHAMESLKYSKLLFFNFLNAIGITKTEEDEKINAQKRKIELQKKFGGLKSQLEQKQMLISEKMAASRLNQSEKIIEKQRKKELEIKLQKLEDSKKTDYWKNQEAQLILRQGISEKKITLKHQRHLLKLRLNQKIKDLKKNLLEEKAEAKKKIEAERKDEKSRITESRRKRLREFLHNAGFYKTPEEKIQIALQKEKEEQEEEKRKQEKMEARRKEEESKKKQNEELKLQMAHSFSNASNPIGKFLFNILHGAGILNTKQEREDEIKMKERELIIIKQINRQKELEEEERQKHQEKILLDNKRMEIEEQNKRKKGILEHYNEEMLQLRLQEKLKAKIDSIKIKDGLRKLNESNKLIENRIKIQEAVSRIEAEQQKERVKLAKEKKKVEAERMAERELKREYGTIKEKEMTIKMENLHKHEIIGQNRERSLRSLADHARHSSDPFFRACAIHLMQAHKSLDIHDRHSAKILYIKARREYLKLSAQHQSKIYRNFMELYGRLK